ncbi:hypothetical protein R1sor_017634 [Riccia sorocarpa]|uniref:Putative nuclease HARBI1 n=1 Tax=Riccia sorocarpa TaxID=122646 RepID=A0ABD3IBG0_9MARC
MVNFTSRVMEALECRLGGEVKWPDRAERRRISDEFSSKGFPNCVGLIDGTMIPLSQRPHFDGEVYYDRKGRYSFNLQVVCDEKRRIIYFCTGWPGSCQDIALCSYKISNNDRDREEFNKCIAHTRIVNEHCIGVLKARWHSLHELRCQLKQDKDNKYAVNWISVCIYLHNYLNGKDDWTEEDSPLTFDIEDYPHEAENVQVSTRDIGIALRESLRAECLTHNRALGGFLKQRPRE